MWGSLFFNRRIVMVTIDKTKQYSERMALSVMKRYTPDKVRWHYQDGLVLQSIFLLGKKTGKMEWCDWVKAMYDTKVRNDGTIEIYNGEEYSLDPINPGKTLFLLYEKYGEEKYRKAIEYLMDCLRIHPRTRSNGFWHKKNYPWQMWLDGLYMAGPFYARYIAEFGNEADYDDVVHQFVLIEEKARKKENGLLFHAWDESNSRAWVNKETSCSRYVWGRGLGWFCMALPDMLEILPEKHQKHRESLLAISSRVMNAILNVQDKKSGMWYQIMDMPDEEKNYLESSGTAMFTYFLFKMLRLGLVPQADISRVKEAARNAYQGLIREKIQEDESGELHLTDICKGAGLGVAPMQQHYRDGSLDYYLVQEPKVADDFKGVGPFILAAMEAEDA